MRIIGLDPGLRHTGWGIVEAQRGKMSFVAAGVVSPDEDLPLSGRLAELHRALAQIIADWTPDAAAIEETFVNKNPSSTLKLGQARGVVLLAPALAGLPVGEYTPNQIKKMVVGTGHADKRQVDMMVRTILKSVPAQVPPDASDALAIALTHAFMRR
ncbi:MAG: crossover junction endodeoxyribonuclease RuvC [Alphaproteobacteria bacterium]|nr:crossover junction endodeoxyribonuclease RuvC [Alphaproteobacteria bacterium]